MIKLKKDRRTIRETKAPFEFNDPESGELKTEEIRILYYSPTTQHTKEVQREMRKREDEGEKVTWYFSDSLIRLLHSLPDLIDEETDKPHVITIEFLDSLDAVNLEAINTAITEDIRAGKSQPAK
jgi:hypothetical protein